MQKRHTDPERYFNEQAESTRKHILPFISTCIEIKAGMHILEIGCGEAGNLKPFVDSGCNCVGVDYSSAKIENGQKFYGSHPRKENIKLISEDIYKTREFDALFDIIILRDVIEHIHNQDKFLSLMKSLLSPTGIAFFAFPPWQSPFGGHQQICNNRLLSVLPYFHLLPIPLYKAVLKLGGEETPKIEGLLEIKETGISLDDFEKLIIKNNYELIKKTIFLINPNYEIKFGLKPRILNGFLSRVKWLRNFYSTCGYYLIKNK